jgi:serine protease Do
MFPTHKLATVFHRVFALVVPLAAMLWSGGHEGRSFTLSATVDPPPRIPIHEVLVEAQTKIVKIYGAGGFRGLETYQSGMLISPDGYILTVFSYVLDTDYITAVLHDGRKYEAQLIGADPRLEAAVLKINATGLPYFDLGRAVRAEAGTRVFALSNLFGVAQGNEPASVQEGVISVVAALAARRGVFETPYNGTVYVLDAVTNNPGAAGGALISRRGELLAMLGKELRNALNNTWLNYAIPIEELRKSVEEIRSGKFVARRAEETEQKPPHGLKLSALGITLLPDMLERTPPFVDSVRPDSPAARAGIKPDDLIVLLGDRLIQSYKSLLTELEYVPDDAEIRLTVIRGTELLEFNLRGELPK